MSEINSKLSSQARMMLDELPEDSNPTVGALLEVNRPVGSPERETLADAGAVVQSTTGRIVTVQVPIRSLHQVAALDFVTYVEVSTPMSPEE